LSLLKLDIGLPVDELRERVKRLLAGKSHGEKIALDAINRRGQAVKCYVSRTIRRDAGGDPEGVVLLMEAQSR
jgi:two-component system CheB/CheR fusion protein